MAKLSINSEMTNDSLLISAPASEKGNVNIFSNPEFGTVRTVVINDEVWFVGNDVASCLRYQNPNNAIRAHVEEEDKIITNMSNLKENLPDHIKSSKICIINKNGVLELISKSRNISSNQKDLLLDRFGLSSYIYKRSRKEIDFKECLIRFFSAFGYEVIHQYRVGVYFLDFFVPSINIGIEYDENNHRDYDKSKEEERENFIKNSIGCKIIRISDEHDNYYNLGIISKYISFP